MVNTNFDLRNIIVLGILWLFANSRFKASVRLIVYILGAEMILHFVQPRFKDVRLWRFSKLRTKINSKICLIIVLTMFSFLTTFSLTAFHVEPNFNVARYRLMYIFG